MSVISSPALFMGEDGYQISRSVRLRSSASAYFNRTPASAGNRKTWTFSTWVKLGSLSTPLNLLYAYSADTDSGLCQLSFQSNQLRIQGISASFLMVSTPVYRDPSAWYHIVYKVDTTQATAADRIRVYVNGVEITAWSTNSPPSQNTDTAINNSVAHNIGRNTRNSNDYLDGYFAETYLIDGQALTPSSFGENDSITGVWKPKKYAGTYGTNGFYLNFSDNSNNTAATIGKDSSGNGNNWTPNNISVTAGVTYDSMIDTPTPYADGGNGRGNYAVLNPIDTSSSITVSNGNLNYTSSAASWIGGRATFAMPTSGKWYWEHTVSGSPVSFISALAPASANVYSNGYTNTNVYAVVQNDDFRYSNTSQATQTAQGRALVDGDVVCWCVDCDTNTVSVRVNGNTWYTWSQALTQSLTYSPAFWVYGSGYSNSHFFNFGQRPFAYTPPSGFKALNTQNLPDSTIKKGNQYFDATAYAGSASQQTITTNLLGLDFAWIKNRTTARDHVLVDTVRGGSPMLTLYSDLLAGEDNSSPNYNPTSISGSGITLGGAKLGINNSGENFVMWGWKKGATPGFDIVTYTGNGTSQNIAHSLGVAPKMMIAFARNLAGRAHPVYHTSTGNASGCFLASTAAANSQPNLWNSTTPTSSVFTVGADNETNNSGNTYVNYLWAEVAGFSKFGSYTGNGSTDGPFVYCGFRPRYVLRKRTDTSAYWVIHDSSRDPYNATQYDLYPNDSLAEATDAVLDFTSNGFKIRGSGANINASGGTYIYAAFAENPFKNALAR